MSIVTTIRRRAPRRGARPPFTPGARRAPVDSVTSLLLTLQPPVSPGRGRRVAHPSERGSARRAPGAPTHRADGLAR